VIALHTDDRLLARFARELEPVQPVQPVQPVPPVLPDLSAWPTEDREAARVAWASRIVDEYRSVAVFSELLLLLAELEAPYAALGAVQRLIGDELRHARMSARVVDWLGGADDLAIDLAELGLPGRAASETKARRALHIIARELVVAEEESVEILAAYRDATAAGPIRDVFSSLLRDEVRHAAAGRALLRLFQDGALASSITAEDRATVAAVMASDRAQLRAGYVESAVGGPGRGLGACIEATDL
jgi:hypothetical protein